MDNTKKRKIVRNFVIGYLIIQVLTIVVYLDTVSSSVSEVR